MRRRAAPSWMKGTLLLHSLLPSTHARPQAESILPSSAPLTARWGWGFVGFHTPHTVKRAERGGQGGEVQCSAERYVRAVVRACSCTYPAGRPGSAGSARSYAPRILFPAIRDAGDRDGLGWCWLWTGKRSVRGDGRSPDAKSGDNRSADCLSAHQDEPRCRGGLPGGANDLPVVRSMQDAHAFVGRVVRQAGEGQDRTVPRPILHSDYRP